MFELCTFIRTFLSQHTQYCVMESITKRNEQYKRFLLDIIMVTLQLLSYVQLPDLNMKQQDVLDPFPKTDDSIKTEVTRITSN